VYAASGLIGGDGSVIALNHTAGVVVTVSRVGTGEYHLAVSGLGSVLCPIPTLTGSATPFSLDFADGTCGAGSFDNDIYTSDGQDHVWGFSFIGYDPAPAAAAAHTLQRTAAGRRAASRRTIRISAQRR
jgi:hypothetical protein